MFDTHPKGMPQKKILLMAGHEGKNNVFLNLFSNVPKFQRPLSSRGGGLGLNCPAIKRKTFFAASLDCTENMTLKHI